MGVHGFVGSVLGSGGGEGWAGGARRWDDGWESDGMSEVYLWGEQLDQGAATLPTLSFLRRINDCVRPVLVRGCAGLTHMHALPPPRTLPPHLIYTDIIDPRHATFTRNNV